MNGIECAYVGRLGKDPELRTAQSGKAWLRLSIAVGHGDDLSWVLTAVFGERAQELAGRLFKGDKVYVEGRLNLRIWEKNGQTQAGLSVAAWKVEKLGQIGRNKPAKPKAPPEGDHTVSPSVHDWQAPSGDALERTTERCSMPDDPIPF